MSFDSEHDDEFFYVEDLYYTNECVSTATAWVPTHEQVVEGMHLQSVEDFFESSESPAFELIPF